MLEIIRRLFGFLTHRDLREKNEVSMEEYRREREKLEKNLENDSLEMSAEEKLRLIVKASRDQNVEGRTTFGENRET